MPSNGCDTRDKRSPGCSEGEGLVIIRDHDADQLNSTQADNGTADATWDDDSHDDVVLEATHNRCAPLELQEHPVLGSGARSPRQTSCDDSLSDAHDQPTFGETNGASENKGAQRGQVILVVTGACMLLVSGALLVVLCALCVKRYRRRSAVQRMAGPLTAAHGMQPPLWDPYPRGGVRPSIASASSGLSPKASSQHHLYVELPDSTLALGIKEPPSMSSSRTAPLPPYHTGTPPPFLVDVNSLDGTPNAAAASFPHTIHFTSYMPILLHPALSGVQIPGTINASLQPISPLYAAPAGLPVAGSGRLHPPSDAQDPPGSAASSSRPLSEAQPDRPIDPDLLRRRQSLRQPYQEMLHSCNSDSTADTVFVRLQQPGPAAEVTAIGLPSSEGVLGSHQRDARAAIGLPSIAPPVDVAAGGALVAALSHRDATTPALGLPVPELRSCHSAPQSAASLAPARRAAVPVDIKAVLTAEEGFGACAVAASAPIMPVEPPPEEEACTSPRSAEVMAGADAETDSDSASAKSFVQDETIKSTGK